MKEGFHSICARDAGSSGKIRPHILPVYQSSTFLYDNPDAIREVGGEGEENFVYSRWGNPTTNAVEEKLARLEGYDLEEEAGALLFGSGMAAISAAVLACVHQGMKVLTHPNIYGTSVEMLKETLGRFGVEVVFADLTDGKSVKSILNEDPDIRLLYIETPSNPALACYDLKELAQLSKKAQIKTVVDSTFATPYLQRPLNYGVDLVVHSATKFLNGHGTGISGAVIGWDRKFVKKEVWALRKTLGGMCSPMEAWLLNNGLKTLPLRMDRHCSNARKVAEFLDDHPAISAVHYPGLATHPSHSIASRQMKDFGGMVSFDLKGGYLTARTMMEKIRYCHLTASLGTTDTLIQHPASMSHWNVPKEQREEAGISESMIRMAVGLEDTADILDDLKQALED